MVLHRDLMDKTIRIYGGIGCGCSELAQVRYDIEHRAYLTECPFCGEVKILGTNKEVGMVDFVLNFLTVYGSFPEKNNFELDFKEREIRKHYRRILKLNTKFLSR